MITGEATFRRLVEQHGDRILGLATRILGDAARAEDVVQEVFLQLYRRHRDIRDRSAVGSWLYRTTLNRSFDALRQRGRIQRAEAEARRPDGPGDDEWLRAQVAQLSPAQRAAVTLVYGEGMTPAEAADVLGCPANTLRQRLYAARERLKSKLSEGPRHDTPPCVA